MIRKPTASVLAAAFIASMTAAQAMAASANDLCPNGNLMTIRVSKISPKGSTAGFEKAVADHAKWYADHGYGEDKIVSAPILVYDEANKTEVQATNELMTIHTNAHPVPRDKHDAAWDAYVAEYRANAEYGAETTACMPK